MSESAPRSGEYQDGKLWFQRRGSTLTIGVTLSGVEDVGEPDGIEFPDEGDDFTKGDILLTVEGSRGKLEVTAPASGTVKDVNGDARNEPGMVSEDPLEEGWLIKLEIQDSTDLQDL